ncbi:PHB depolymerase family esterase [Salinibacterium sp. SWN139]|nr:PHB depolymerase family esterase [Salinibacterium sp. SWN139]
MTLGAKTGLRRAEVFRMSTVKRRLTIPAVLASLALVSATLAGAPLAAHAITCPPGFEMLPGCSNSSDPGGSAAVPGTWATETVAGMSTRIYTPSTAAELPAGRALMISLHGCAQKASDFQANANWVAAAEDYGMVVALPDAPNGGVVFGCWDYYDSNHSRSNPARHDDNLLNLATTLTARASLGIDADQVYISGLSSGGGETMVMGCLAPDIFAGMGINAGPTVGTTSGQISSVAVSKSQGTNTCTSFGSANSAAFSTQLTSVIYGSNDSTVSTGYNTLNGQIMAGIYGASSTSTFSLSGLAGNNTAGSGTLYSDATGPRVSVIQNSNLGHNWPAGAGTGGTYINANSVDYPAYVTGFFFDNNRRVDRTGTPGPDPTPTPTPTSTPTPTPTPDPVTCFTATNAQHAAAGRAFAYGFNPYNPYYAKGSLSYLGQGDATITSLSQVSATSWAKTASCG